jgi:hypothetical protein
MYLKYVSCWQSTNNVSVSLLPQTTRGITWYTDICKSIQCSVRYLKFCIQTQHCCYYGLSGYEQEATDLQNLMSLRRISLFLVDILSQISIYDARHHRRVLRSQGLIVLSLFSTFWKKKGLFSFHVVSSWLIF